MARSFTINFPYNGGNYAAVISQIDGSTTIYIPNHTLQTLIPQGRFSFNLQQGVQIDKPQLTPAQDLIVTVIGVIEAKCQEAEAGK